MTVWAVAITVLLLNLPFGYWLANVRTFSLQWFMAIHLPVVLVIALRIFSGWGWQLATVLLLIGVFFAGQLSGARVHLWWSRRARAPVTSCLVMDLMRGFQASRQGACR